MNKRYRRIIFIGFALLLAFCGCAIAPVSINNVSQTEMKQPDTSIKIGTILTLSGAASEFGKSALDGIDMAVKEINDAGGALGRQIKIISEDDKGEPSEGARAAARLASKKELAGIIGTIMSKISLSCAPIAQTAKIPMITPTSTNEKVTQTGEFIFRTCFIDPYQGVLGASFAYKSLRTRKAAVLYSDETDYTKGMAESFRLAYEKAGGLIVAYESYAPKKTDFKSMILKALSVYPDILYLPNYYVDVALIAKQARALGFNGPLLGGDGWDSPSLSKIAGNSINNGFFVNHFVADDTTSRVQVFVNRFTSRYGHQPDALAALGYDSVYILVDAIKRAGTIEGKGLQKALTETNFDCVTGRITFDVNRNPIKPGVVIEMKDGKQVFKAEVEQ